MNNLVEVNNKELEVKEYGGKRVVTFKEIDMIHERTEGTAGKNFRNNKKHFIEGVDYFEVTAKNSDTINSPKNGQSLEDYGFSKFASNGILITESGYLMLVKSFTDDLAWDVQRDLVSKYFRKTENPYLNMSKELQAIFMVDKKQQELEKGQEVLTEKVTNLENKMTINYELAENIRSEVSAKAVHSLGGYNSPAYKKLSKKAYSALHRDLRGYFKVNSYKNLSIKRYEEAINYIQGWTPGTNLRLEIKEMNNQIEFAIN
ncbi:ORF6C domain-containing protein [Metaclostridioides mangenotii]|uniref:KilA-N DNA-binding domain-containing protein n=1 Tax=Metaclostridioides mangenotii TaxID=1540 RepID=A0ABS4EBQ2_9FIRM|nr:ORF6C domain-containing protein [Clostridioides mangenotii]MBP1855371.1 hypothetical protein [Clostridioides mangenotii]